MKFQVKLQITGHRMASKLPYTVKATIENMMCFSAVIFNEFQIYEQRLIKEDIDAMDSIVYPRQTRVDIFNVNFI